MSEEVAGVLGAEDVVEEDAGSRSTSARFTVHGGRHRGEEDEEGREEDGGGGEEGTLDEREGGDASRL